MGKTGKRPTKSKGNGKPAPAKKPTPGCYVLSLTVENIRCFGPKQTLDCSDGGGRPRQWTVILGDNGTGKTTLLYAIALHERGGISHSDGYGKGLLRRNGKEGRSILDVATGWTDAPATSPRQLSMFGSYATKSESTGIEKWRDADLMQSSETKRSLAFFGYGSERLRYQTGARPPKGTSEYDTDPLFADALLHDVERWLLDLDYAALFTREAKVRTRLDQISDMLCGLLPGVKKIGFYPGAGPVSKPHVEFETGFGIVPLRQLGHGYQTMIAWVVDFVSRMVERYPESENPLAEPAVCLVDEIDLHLHPVWQRKVIGYLSERFPNTQFIVTAHSPLVVQAAASANANIAVLVRSAEKDADGNHYVEIRNNPEDVRNWRLDQILTSDLFGMSSARPVEVEALFTRKQELLDKAKLSKVEQDELGRIEAQLRELPFGETKGDRSAIQDVRESLELLKRKLAQ